MKIMVGKAPDSAGDLASQPTLSRFGTGLPPRTYAASPMGCWSCTSKPIPAPGRPLSLTWTPPMTLPMGSSSSASFTGITKNICIIRSSSSMAATVFLWLRCCARAIPRLQGSAGGTPAVDQEAEKGLSRGPDPLRADTVLPCPPSMTIWKGSRKSATLSVSSPTTGSWKKPRRSF